MLNCRLTYFMKELTKQQFNSIVAEIAEFGTGVVQTRDKEPPWIVRNINGFIYAVENMGEHIICTVLIPSNILKTVSTLELENSLEKLNQIHNDKYGYSIKHIAETSLIVISAYYFREDFVIARDIKALEQHALHILNEI